MPQLHPVPVAALVLGVYGLCYFGMAHLLGVPQAAMVVRRVLGKLRLTRR